jgi:hypothetical protein
MKVTPINTAPADRDLTAMDRFDRVTERRAIEKARNIFFRAGGWVTRYAIDGTRLGRYRVAFGKVVEEGKVLPLPG